MPVGLINLTTYSFYSDLSIFIFKLISFLKTHLQLLCPQRASFPQASPLGLRLWAREAFMKQEKTKNGLKLGFELKIQTRGYCLHIVYKKHSWLLVVTLILKVALGF